MFTYLEKITMHSLGLRFCSFRLAHSQSEVSYKDDKIRTQTGGGRGGDWISENSKDSE